MQARVPKLSPQTACPQSNRYCEFLKRLSSNWFCLTLACLHYMICKVDREASVSFERIIAGKAVRAVPVTPQVSLQELVSIIITHLFNLT